MSDMLLDILLNMHLLAAVCWGRPACKRTCDELTACLTAPGQWLARAACRLQKPSEVVRLTSTSVSADLAGGGCSSERSTQLQVQRVAIIAMSCRHVLFCSATSSPLESSTAHVQL